MVEGISHVTLIVADIGRTAALLKGLLGAREVYDSGDNAFSLSVEKFLTVGGVWVALMKGDPLPNRTYNHIALKVPEADFDEYERKAADMGLETLPPRPRVCGEGRSFYFYDYDNHLFELHTGTLEERLQAYRRITAGE